MGLNKRGWGLAELLILSAILLIFLLIATYYIYVLYDTLDKNAYNSLEAKVVESARNYDKDYGFKKIITVKKLKASLYLNSLLDNNDNKCSGYAIKENGVIDAYIKCNNYQTNNYNEKYDE